jgi:hypothetical protein
VSTVAEAVRAFIPVLRSSQGFRNYFHTVPLDKTHPHLHPPLEGEEALLFSPFKGEIERGMGLKPIPFT